MATQFKHLETRPTPIPAREACRGMYPTTRPNTRVAYIAGEAATAVHHAMANLPPNVQAATLDELNDEGSAAAAISPAMQMGLHYAAANRLYDQIDAACIAGPATRAAWLGVTALAGAVMTQPPKGLDDLLLQTATAASWIGFIVDALEEDSPGRDIALAIGTTLENGALLLNRLTPAERTPCADLIACQIDELIRCGAELAPEECSGTDRQDPWAEAFSVHLAKEAAADDAGNGQLDDLIQNTPAPQVAA